MTTALAPEDFDDLYEYIRMQVTAGFATVPEIVAEAVEVFADTTLAPEALREAAGQLAEKAVAEHRAAQGDWPETTDCDRIDAAFAALDGIGIVARQHFSCCGSCGANDILDECKSVSTDGGTVRGYTFFHVQDTESAVGGESLFLSYGTVDGDKDAAVAVGLHPAWNGRHANRIGLPVVWQRRGTASA
jgi:hypothetical protein